MRVAAVIACFAGLLLAAASADAAVLAGNTGWAWGNPSPQPNALGLVDSAEGRLYAAGASGTLVTSADAGDSWRAISTGVLEPLLHVEALRSTSVVFATACSLRRSDDDGRSVRILPWTASQTSCADPIAAVAFPSLSTGYLMLASGAFLTTEDGGYSWQQSPPIPGTPAAGGGGNPVDISFSGRLNGVALVGTKVMRTTDGGTTWNEAFDTASVTPRAIDFADANNGFVVGDAGASWRTNDGGASFTPLVTGAGVGQSQLGSLRCGAALVCLATDRARGSVVEISVAGSRSLETPGVVGLGEAAPSAARYVAVGENGSVAASSDAGVSWAPIGNRLGSSFHGLRAHSSRVAYAFGARGALAVTDDGGMSWSNIPFATTARVFDVALDADRSGPAITSDGLLHHFEDGVERRSVNVGTPAPALRGLPGGKVLLVGPRGLRIVSGSSGKGRAAPGVGRKTALNALDASSAGLIAFGRNAAFAASRRGDRWARMPLPPTRSIASLDFVTPSTGYVLDRRGELWFTETRGRSWRRIDTTGDTAFTSVAFADVRHGYLASATGRILHIRDGGSTWTRQFPFFDALQDSPLAIEATGRLTAIALGVGSNRLLATTTGGQAGAQSFIALGEGDRRIRRQGSVQVRGQLLPAKGGEAVTVLARAKGSKPGAKWISRTVTTTADGRFSTVWKISQRTVFLARWSGDAGREAVAAPPVVVAPTKRR